MVLWELQDLVVDKFSLAGFPQSLKILESLNTYIGCDLQMLTFFDCFVLSPTLYMLNITIVLFNIGE